MSKVFIFCRMRTNPGVITTICSAFAAVFVRDTEGVVEIEKCELDVFFSEEDHTVWWKLTRYPTKKYAWGGGGLCIAVNPTKPLGCLVFLLSVITTICSYCYSGLVAKSVYVS